METARNAVARAAERAKKARAQVVEARARLSIAKTLARVKAVEEANEAKLADLRATLAERAERDLAAAHEAFEQRWLKSRSKVDERKLKAAEKKLKAKAQAAEKKAKAKIAETERWQ